MSKAPNITGYKVKKELGAGGMARVYLAADTKLDRPVALKVLNASIAQENPRVTKRFIKEAKIAAKLNHSNIVSIFDVGKSGGVYYIAMEYLTENLKDRIKRGIKPREALGIIKEVAKALSYAHNKGFVHRDIKADNIMFRKDGAAVLVDFGIVKVINEIEKTKLTRTGMSIGTPQYMSPEQVKARKIDGRSDIYSLGIVLYEMLTGRVPYDDDDVITVALKHTDGPVPQLPSRLKDFQPLVDKMLAKKTGDRVRNAEGLIRLIDALEFKLKSQTANPHRNSREKKPRKSKALTFFSILVIIALTAGSIHLIRQSNRKKEDAAWQKARTVHTEASYRRYLDDFPEGGRQAEARQAIAQLEKKRRYQRAYQQAREYYNQGNYNAALKKITEAKKINPTAAARELEERIRQAREGK
jgi:serine/threonine protein kinase